jgi:catechol 2,3-dioxygenase-like lactoylglutathione lyase family enzyme
VPPFNHVGHCVTDLERSTRFYVEALGFRHLVERDLAVPEAMASRLLRVPEPVGMQARYLQLGDFTLELLHFDREGNAPARERSFTEPGLTHLSVSVDDLAATCALVREHGGDVLEDTDMGGRAIMVTDPDGQLVELLPSTWSP